MTSNRSAGIILHPTSLPGPDGIGDLGPEAYRWVDFLAKSGFSLWQVLPLNPTGYGDSPYQSFSAFAGNPYLISPAILMDEGLLTRQDLADRPAFPNGSVDYGPVIEWKLTLLNRAYDHFQASEFPELTKEFNKFKKQQLSWLDDLSLFMAIKESRGGVSWDNWPEDLRKRKPSAVKAFKKEHESIIDSHCFRQFIFFRQWAALRTYAHQKSIKIIGDAPIFVAYDSADAWAHTELFYIDSQGKPTVVAGVPPDYFSATGQLWGNPLYRWDVHAESGYSWWIDRLRAIFQVVDIVRLDHFRGFAGYWEVPAGNPTAEIGRWVPGPGASLFEALKQAFGDLPIIAEDLGVITADVNELREKFNLPGMKLLQFAFSTDPDDPFLPHNYPPNCVAYTGTHDNDTSRGWYLSAPEGESDFARRYLARSGDDISWDFLRCIWSSAAVMTLAPLQDFLSLDTSARLNYPGKPSGNWSWRMPADTLSDFLSSRCREANYLYGRLPVTGQKVVKRHI